MSNPVGRPPKFKTAEEMQMVIDDYFGSVTYTDDNGITHCKPTMGGLALALDMSRTALCNYAEKDEFVNTIKKARNKVEAALEEHLNYAGQPTGIIFNLKNNFGWQDKQEIDHTSKGKRMRNSWTVLPVTTDKDG